MATVNHYTDYHMHNLNRLQCHDIHLISEILTICLDWSSIIGTTECSCRESTVICVFAAAARTALSSQTSTTYCLSTCRSWNVKLTNQFYSVQFLERTELSLPYLYMLPLRGVYIKKKHLCQLILHETTEVSRSVGLKMCWWRYRHSPLFLFLQFFLSLSGVRWLVQSICR
jgi:hypothetical protein